MAKFFIAAALFTFVPANLAYAQVQYLPIVQCGRTAADAPAAHKKDCTTCDFVKMVKNVIDLMIYMVTPALATFLFIIAGFLMLLSGANPSYFTQAKRIFTETIWAVVVILCAWMIVNTFIQSFGPPSAAGNWFQFSCPTGM